MSEVQAPTTVERGTAGTVLRRWMVRPEAPALVFLAILVVAFSLSSDKFLSGSNLESILVSVAVLGTIALAVNQVILCGEIDISTGSMMGLCAVAAGAVATSTGGLLLPLLAGVAVGALAGAVNGLLVTLGRIPSIIVTLGMLYALRGVILLVTGGSWITGIPSETRVLGIGSVLGIGYPVFVLLILFVAMGARQSPLDLGPERLRRRRQPSGLPFGGAPDRTRPFHGLRDGGRLRRHSVHHLPGTGGVRADQYRDRPGASGRCGRGDRRHKHLGGAGFDAGRASPGRYS
jgi:Ribose/xylose/arabinose/galactoside ABC-type transport systems, permease components